MNRVVVRAKRNVRYFSSISKHILATEESGDKTKKPVVFLHGLLGNKNNFKATSKALGDDYRAIVCDLTNHGFSPHDNRFENSKF
jgi:pimeloyl-ACP methyl ester carboxylesterase